MHARGSRRRHPSPLLSGPNLGPLGEACSPAVSVLLPVRDAVDTLPRALHSLLRQNLPHMEIITVDDGSTDGSRAYLNTMATADPRVRVVTNRGDGLVAALECARAEARAPLLARMDADDISHPQRLELQTQYLEDHPAVAAVGTQVYLFPRTALGAGWRRYERWLNGLLSPADHARELFVESPLAHPSVLMRADAVEAVGGYRETAWAEDYDLWLRLSQAGYELAKIERRLLAWRHSEQRLSARSPRYSHAAFLKARAHFLTRHRLFAAGQLAIWGAGRTGRRLRTLLAAEGVTVERFYDVDPAKVGRRLRGAPVYSWRDLAPPGKLPLLVAVGAPGARAQIRPELRRKGYREGVDVLFAA